MHDLLSGLAAAAAENSGGLNVLLDFRDPTSSRAVHALKTELTKLMETTGIEFGYLLGRELGPDNSPTDIIVVRF